MQGKDDHMSMASVYFGEAVADAQRLEEAIHAVGLPIGRQIVGLFLYLALVLGHRLKEKTPAIEQAESRCIEIIDECPDCVPFVLNKLAMVLSQADKDFNKKNGL